MPSTTEPVDCSRPPVEKMSSPARFVVLAYLISATVYLVWRGTTMNPLAPIFSRLIYGAEVFAFGCNLLHLFMVWRLTVRVAPVPAPGSKVDIFIPTCNESIDIVRRAVLAATKVDYPHGVWLLDDGDRPTMKALAEEFGIQYLARQDKRHAKAGNLNNALLHSTAEFIAIFDADHAPKRHFLTETLGYFCDPGVAFVQTPQDFFNLDSFQHRKSSGRTTVWTGQSLFFRVIQRGKDYWNAALFCGSCAIIRRSALDAVGGFATRSVTEDLETSVAVHKAGWRSVYVPDALAFGIAPSSASSHLRQRLRWGQGAMQVIRREWFFLRGKLTLAQRLNYMASTLSCFDGWQKALFYLAPAWVLVSGAMPLVADSATFLPLFLPYLALTLLVFEESGRGHGRSLFIEQYNMARFAGIIRAPLGLLRDHMKFMGTSKDDLSARAEETRVMAPQIAVAALNVLAIAAGLVIWLFVSRRGLPVGGLVANVLWATVNAVMAGMVVRFTLDRTRDKRRAYRFPVPLPVTIDFGDRQEIATVDDISSLGARVYGRFPLRLRGGDRLTGILHLPGEDLRFDGHIANLMATSGNGAAPRQHNAFSISFDWARRSDEDQLNLFLQGSDLHWHFSRLDARLDTPTERLLNLLRTRRVDEPSRRQWAAISYGAADREHGLVSVATGMGVRVAATRQRLLGVEPIVVRKHSRAGVEPLRIVARHELARLSTPSGTLYLTEVDAAPACPPNPASATAPVARPATSSVVPAFLSL